MDRTALTDRTTLISLSLMDSSPCGEQPGTTVRNPAAVPYARRPLPAPQPQGRKPEGRKPEGRKPAGPKPSARKPDRQEPSSGLAAERPDAAPRRWDHAFRAAAHAVVLLSVVAFVVFYCVWVPVRAHVAAGTRGASVMLVASPLLEVRAPHVAGVFRAARPLAHGQRVRKGELLGRIDSPALEQEIERADVELRVLEARRLRLEQSRTLSESSGPETIEARELAGHAEVISRSLQQLRSTRSKLAVRAPADGLVQVGLPASVAVTPDQAIVSVYPDGGSLLVEVTGPLELVDRLNREGQLTASFPVAGGSAEVEARPLRNSVRCFRKTIEGGREETWATVQCVPFAVPPALHSPGLIGELRR